MMVVLIYALFTYLIASIPFGYIIGRLMGIDVTKRGSGNIGATNVARTIGKKAGFIVLILDMLKGFIPVYIAKNILMEKVGLFTPKDLGLIIIVAILGHCFSIFMKFKGGKGVATALGVLLALSPQVTLIIVLFWLGVFLTTGYVSLASILSAYISWFIYFFIEIKNFSSPDYIYIVLAIFISSMIIIYKHISNLQRLINGTENRFIYNYHRKEDKE